MESPSLTPCPPLYRLDKLQALPSSQLSRSKTLPPSTEVKFNWFTISEGATTFATCCRNRSLMPADQCDVAAAKVSIIVRCIGVMLMDGNLALATYFARNGCRTPRRTTGRMADFPLHCIEEPIESTRARIVVELLGRVLYFLDV
ncbi:protein-glutamine gamma-glutamyltransferase Z-like protein [Anopheles sinensis]|uniref:Protein-glutamine gamma-glutamyltransferase Z-like protein n=1 Tax=Anopheles sinensis TaxID=74873 RepID=A0A084VEU1_ANOSI|nr:protein-glutamine gamma-glutamyltransferase Z-like protein [Anopheles sinensis]